ncbi:phytanoyl-CoA dioxygenase family protein [Lysobacter sp. CA199]|uniref:phytanoyl-CoA dioxygenase family protein n=1 Tax=Lysobacter sp. CA199 TaxID=3455608 RepID=UPI003F8D1672
MLTPEQKQQFDDQGYLVIDPQIDTAVIDGVVERIGNGLLLGDGPDQQRIADAWRRDAGARQIAKAPAVLAILEELYGRKPLPFQTLNFRVGTQQKEHSDTVHFNAAPAGYMCGVWVALEDIDENNGAVIYYPGSHKLREWNMADVFAEPDLGARRPKPLYPPLSPKALRHRLKGLGPLLDTTAEYTLYEEFIQRQLPKMGIPPALATIRKGQAFVWAANLLHGGSRRNDLSRTRHSQVSHYYFEGCKYHRPLLNSDGKTRYFKPDWVV